MQRSIFLSKYDFRGARGKIDIEKLPENIYVFDATHILSKEHLIIAFYHAARAFEIGKSISSKIYIETMLYLAGDRQISVAKKLYEPKKEGCYAIIHEKSFDIEKLLKLHDIVLDDSVLEISEEKIKNLRLEGIFKNHPVEYVIEKMALLNLRS